MILSAEQIKAARAMLDWTQDILAYESGLSPNTIRNLEKGYISIRSSMDVRKTFENRGFEFAGKNGLLRHSDEHRTYHGADSCDQFYGDLLATVQEKNCEIAGIFKSQEMFKRALGITNISRLERLEQIGKHAKVKCLITDMRQISTFMSSFEFRAMPHNPFCPMGSLIYDDKTVIVVTNGIEFTFFVFKSTNVARGSRKEFDAHWDAATPFTSPASQTK